MADAPLPVSRSAPTDPASSCRPAGTASGGETPSGLGPGSRRGGARGGITVLIDMVANHSSRARKIRQPVPDARGPSTDEFRADEVSADMAPGPTSSGRTAPATVTATRGSTARERRCARMFRVSGRDTGLWRWRSWVTSTGAPTTWRTVIMVAFGAAAAGLASLALHGEDRPTAVAVAAVAGGLVAAAGANVPAPLAVPVVTGAIAVVMTFEVVAVAVQGNPWAAALAMAAVAVFTSVGAGAGPLGAAFGLLATLGYVLTALLASLLPAPDSFGGFALTATGAPIGAAVGALVTVIATAPGRRRSGQPAAVPTPWRAMRRSVVTFDEHVRDGLRRAIPLAVFVGVYEATGNHDVLWAFVAALVVLLPTGKSPITVAVVRVVTTLVGVALLLPLAAVIPTSVLVGAGAVLVVGSVAYRPRYPLLAGAATAMGAVILVGAPSGAISDFAVLRLLDTAVGAGVALASTYLLWPKDAPDDDPEAVAPSCAGGT